MSNVARIGSGSRTRMAGSNSMPTETKNSTAKASRNGRVSVAACWLSFDSLKIMPAKKAPSAKDTPKSSAAPNAVPSAITRTDRRNNSREPVCAMACRIHGMSLLPTISMTATKATTLAAVRPSARCDFGETRTALARAPEQAGNDRQEHEGQHHCDILDDEPAHRDPAALGLDQAPLLHRAQQDDGARHRERKPEHEPRGVRPAEPRGKSHAEQRRAENLGDGSWNRDLLDRQKIVEREVQAHAEHQEDDADLGQLAGEILVGDIAGRERPDDDPGEKIADERRKLQSMGNGRERPSQTQGGDDRGDERRVMRH